jgi:pyruvate ferredoxin oxidoreductase gamma subunit
MWFLPDYARATLFYGGWMFEVRIHGRGGQGVVTAAELLSVAAFDEGRHAQAFPSFGSERTGAPVVAFCRFSEEPIRTREPVAEPDALIVQDPTLLHQVDVFAGLGRGGYALINTGRSIEALGLDEFAGAFESGHLLAIPATALAREHLGRPMPNAALLGGFAALTGSLRLSSVLAAVRERFPGEAGEGNAAAAQACHDRVKERLEAVAGV